VFVRAARPARAAQRHGQSVGSRDLHVHAICTTVPHDFLSGDAVAADQRYRWPGADDHEHLFRDRTVNHETCSLGLGGSGAGCSTEVGWPDSTSPTRPVTSPRGSSNVDSSRLTSATRSAFSRYGMNALLNPAMMISLIVRSDQP